MNEFEPCEECGELTRHRVPTQSRVMVVCKDKTCREFRYNKGYLMGFMDALLLMEDEIMKESQES